MVGLTFSVLQMRQLGLDPKLGVEQQLAARAKADHKPITGLETAQQQLAIFDALPDALQLRFLDQTLEESKDAPRELAQMTRAWKRGDEKQLASELLEEYRLVGRYPLNLTPERIRITPIEDVFR